ncbi:MAG TPA: carbon-nitrogen hydrolase family protein [Flavitalea sp.]|nr:carbon-nitrogen hydrolase family protein [Flavitalea sp.]
MSSGQHDSRRNFLKQSTLGLGAGLFTATNPFTPVSITGAPAKLASEITIATIDLIGLKEQATREERVQGILDRMNQTTGMKPDVICLPELFDTMWVQEQKPINEVAEDEKVPGPVTSKIAAFARKNSCYIVCPIFTKSQDHFYNSALLIDRKGNIAGVYHKTHPVKSEILPDQAYKGPGVTPGAIDQPIIQTDFGKVGMQICYDAYWSDGWDNLRDKHADIVFFPSAMPAGRILNHYAVKNNYYVVSSTGEDGRIIDISGNTIDCTSDFMRLAWTTVNMKKVNVDVWPANEKIADLYKKYGNKIGVKVWNETDVITIENRDPHLELATVLKEFDIEVFSDYLQSETVIHDKYRIANK